MGRFFSVDPIAENYYYQTTYQFASNSPIWKIELEGLEGVKTNNGTDLQDDSSFSQGWNSNVSSFNNSFFNGVNELLSNPIEAGASLINDAMVEAGQVIADVTGISSAMGIENKTGAAMANAVETASNISNMTNAEQGDLAGSVVTGAIVTAVTKKMPGGQAKGLGNPFKSKSLKQVSNSMEKRVNAGTMTKAGPDPANGKGAYVNNKSGYSYHIDKGGNYGKKGKVIEGPHVDVNYPNPKSKNVPSKKKLDTEN